MSGAARAAAMLADLDAARARLRASSGPWVELDGRGRIVLRGLRRPDGTAPPMLAFGYRSAARLVEAATGTYQPEGESGRAAVARLRARGFGEVRGFTDLGRHGWVPSIADGTES